MRITRFEDIVAWQKAQDVAVDIYTVLDQWKTLDLEIRFAGQRCQYQTISQKDLIEAAMQILFDICIYP